MTVGLLALVMAPAYLCRMNALHVRRDPVWETTGTYLAFVCVVMAGGAAAQSEVMPWHVVMTVAALLWIVSTYYRWAERDMQPAHAQGD